MLWPDEISEGAILHEVHHFEQDKKEVSMTTAGL